MSAVTYIRLFGAALVVLVVFLVAADTQPQSAAPVCADDATKAKLRTLMQEGIDEAMRMQMEHLFAVWTRDQAQQPSRARTGLDQAVAAYVHTYNQIKSWDMKACEK
jgi:hypothetical protein